LEPPANPGRFRPINGRRIFDLLHAGHHRSGLSSDKWVSRETGGSSGRVFQTLDEVRDAVRDFAARYNAEWLIEKNGYISPLDARAARLDTTFRQAA
jgi:hypothetical protein